MSSSSLPDSALQSISLILNRMESTVLPLMSALMTTRDPAGEYVGTASDVTELNVDTTSGRAVSRPRAEVIASTAVMSACIAATIIGNVLVVLSVLTYRPLRGVMQNFYIVSLAVADLAVAHLALAHLAVALLVMPLSVANFVVDGRWSFGVVVCHVWLTADILTRTACRLLTMLHPLNRSVSYMYNTVYCCLKDHR